MNGRYKEGDIVLSDWVLTDLIGAGHFGCVYKAERALFGASDKEYAAIKIITVPKTRSEIEDAINNGMDADGITASYLSIVEEIVREIAIMSKLKANVNIVSYEDHKVIPHDSGIGWDIIIRMELLTKLSSRPPMTRREIINLGMDICRAIEVCQSHGIIHRDIKPANILFSDSGSYKLGDFGVASMGEKSTRGQAKMGTELYMAPEVYLNLPYDQSVDIYSLGIVLYQRLNNNLIPLVSNPTENNVTYSDLKKALEKRVRRTEVIPSPAKATGLLANIVLKACAYEAKDRYSSPKQLREDLWAALNIIDESELDLPIESAASAKKSIVGISIDVSESKFPTLGFFGDVDLSAQNEPLDASLPIKDFTPMPEDGADCAYYAQSIPPKRTTKVILLIIAAIATIVTIALFAFFLLSDSNRGESNISADIDTLVNTSSPELKPEPVPQIKTEPSPVPTPIPKPLPEPTVSPEPKPPPEPRPSPRPDPTDSPEPSPTSTAAPNPRPSPSPTPQPEVITSVNITTNSTMMVLNSTQTLTVSWSPSSISPRLITWSSNDTNVLTVNAGGVVTAVGHGAAVITVNCDGVSARITISVY